MLRKTLAILLVIFSLKSSAQQLVLPGDHPDPSVVKIGNSYWATATTSNWLPAFPLYESKDLVHWSKRAVAFTKLPDWADYYLWAPEISYDKGKVYIYYNGHKKGGSLCVAAAVADRPEGPYKDLGPLIGQPDGSIDAFSMRDENGKLYLIWKEDGNSIGQPTPIWAMEMKEDRTGLIGEKKELFRATEPWESKLVEGVSITRHGEFFYAFYAAAGCCGTSCNYATGIARSKSLLGPWEKFDKNPIISDNASWKCPGHGTPVVFNGQNYFLYHAYNTKSANFAGRQGVLKQFEFTPEGWIQFVENCNGTTPKPVTINDNFAGNKLSLAWQWNVFEKFSKSVKANTLTISALPKVGSFIGQTVYSSDYDVQVTVVSAKSTAAGGLALIGDEKNLLTATVSLNKITVTEVKDGKSRIVAETEITKSPLVTFQLKVRNNSTVTFLYKTSGQTFRELNPEPINAAGLPPWDRGLRAGIVATGKENQSASFKNFMLSDVK
ncbi:family 43 glycosylhydrolase [Pedobacter sp. HMF7647]|uniref:Family 43 glycosylhydrolase n=2 Tax=Hufsiella arboris TaxID=2695275 RepID=A0A7K1YDV0_9SPHI|nr:family 43 glycosylhydrolase [Hufsiella arboris]